MTLMTDTCSMVPIVVMLPPASVVIPNGVIFLQLVQVGLFHPKNS
jgi:hypothetical protein